MKPFEEMAKNAAQIAEAILTRIALFFYVKNKHYYIDENGTIFDFKEIVELNEDKTLSIDGKVITFEGKPLLLTMIKSEGIVEFNKLLNGHIELIDSIDHREGKGIFVNTDGEIYRA